MNKFSKMGIDPYMYGSFDGGPQRAERFTRSSGTEKLVGYSWRFTKRHAPGEQFYQDAKDSWRNELEKWTKHRPNLP